MKKILLLIVVLTLISIGSDAFAKKAEGLWFTDGKPNGVFVVENYSADKEGRKIVGDYLSGVIDCAYALGRNKMQDYYPKCTRADIFDKVATYYRNNPNQQNRTVVDVVLSGCK